MANYGDDTAILCTGSDLEGTSNSLQMHLNITDSWAVQMVNKK